MEQRSDRINFLLTDLDEGDRERLKVSLREIAADTFDPGPRGEPCEEQVAS